MGRDRKQPEYSNDLIDDRNLIRGVKKMNRLMKTHRLEESHEAYMQKRAEDKYTGKAGKDFPLKEFRKCADYLAGILEKASFDEEDLGDMVRVAISKREQAVGI